MSKELSVVFTVAGVFTASIVALLTFVDETTLLRYLVVILAFLAVFAVGIALTLYLNRTETVQAPQVQTQTCGNCDSSPERDRGRPKNPCYLAQIGVVLCPLAENVNVKPNPELVKAVSALVIQSLSSVSIKLAPPTTEPPSAKEVAEEKKDTEKTPKKKETNASEKTQSDDKTVTEKTDEKNTNTKATDAESPQQFIATYAQTKEEPTPTPPPASTAGAPKEKGKKK